MKLWLVVFLMFLLVLVFLVVLVVFVFLVFLCVSWFCLCLNPTGRAGQITALKDHVHVHIFAVLSNQKRP